MDKRELTIDEIHFATLEILKKIIIICEEINIDYYVAYGSLIGVIRHEGFIPWDDDFDIVMMRPDYEKFVKYCIDNKDCLAPFNLLNKETCEGYPYNISRFNDTRYKAVYDYLLPYESGLFIDIYPFDGAGNDIKRVSKRLVKWKNILMKCVLWSRTEIITESKNGNLVKFFLKSLAVKFVKLFGHRFWLDQFDKLGKLYDFDNSQYVGCFVWDFGLVLHKKEWYREAILKKFEGIDVKVPIDYDLVLKNSYGDYMKLPPVEKRVASHGYKVFRRS